MKWIEETHDIKLELVRHFLARMFDGEWSSSPGQWSTVAVGALAVILPAGVIWLDSDYANKYARLSALPLPGPFRSAAIADELAILTLLFAVTGLLALFEWSSLFPSARDYLALAGYPIRPRQIFIARFGAVALFSTAFIAALNFLPSILVPLVFQGRWQINPSYTTNLAAHAIAAVLACYFVFFAILALQGVMLNVLPGRLFSRASAYVQGALITVMMLAALYSWSLKDWPQATIDRLPRFGGWLPPVWFEGLHEWLIGSRDPFFDLMARRGLAATVLAGVLSLAAYLLSYRRYRTLLLESPAALSGPRLRQWSVLRLLAWTPRGFSAKHEAIMHFMSKTLVRSRPHRMIWMAYIGFAVAVVVNSSVIDGRLLMRQSHRQMLGLQFLVLFWPLASSYILLNGFRHVISIPADLKSNWIFRLTESQGRKEWMSAVERFVLAYAVAPIFVILAPVAAYALGWRIALCMTVLQIVVAMFLFEVLFSSWQQLPFACSYLPGKKPMIAIVSSYILILGIVMPLVSFMVAAAAQVYFLFPFYLADFLFIWIWARRIRREGWGEAMLLYEDRPVTVTDLGIKEMTYGGFEARRPAAGDAGHADPQDPAAPPDARLRGGGVHPEDVGGRAEGGGGSALPGAASPGAAGLACVGVGDFGEQPPRQVLPADGGRTAAVAGGVGALEPHGGGDRADHAAGIRLRLRGLLLRRQLDRDLDDELAFHLAMREARFRREGMTAADARAAARRQFGNVGSLRERCRDLWTFTWLETFWQDIRCGARQLRRSPGFTFVAATILALGIGATTAIYSMFDTVLWRPMGALDLPGLVAVTGAVPGQPHFFGPAAAADLEDIRDAATSLESLAIYENVNLNLVDAGGEAIRVEGVRVTPDFFRVASAQPAIGRTFTAGEQRVVVLSDDLWRRRFRADPAIEGRTIRIDGLNCTVVGVMPPDFTLPRSNRKLWLPLEPARGDRASLACLAIGRLKPGRSVEQAAAEIDGIASRLAKTFPATNRDRRFRTWSYQHFLVGDYIPIYETMLLGAAIFVLLIACANVASLQFARAAERRREVAVRLALGAGRRRIVRQLATESVLLAAAGGAMGVLVAGWALALIKWRVPAEIRTYMPGWSQIGLNLHALAFALACAAASGIVAGLAPAWQCSRPNLAESMKEGARGSGAGVRTRLRSILVAAELALAVVLLVGAGLMVRGFQSLVWGGAGLDPGHMLTVHVSLTENQYREPWRIAAFYQDVRDRAGALPGVRSAVVVTAMPFSRASFAQPVAIEGSTKQPEVVQVQAVSPEYFRSLQIPLVSGTTSLEAARSAVVSQAMARRWSLALGRRIQLGAPDGPWLNVAGIVGDMRQSVLSRDPAPTVYVSWQQFPRRDMDIGMRTAGDPMRLAPGLAAAIRAADPEQPYSNMSTLATLISQEAFVFAYMAALMGAFGLIALALSAIGVYGVMSYVAAQLRHEIGVRMALGASRASVLGMLLGRGMRTAAVGMLIGAIPAFGLARLMRAFVWGVSLRDPATLVAIPLALLAAAALAIYVPARRGTRVDPMAALREE